MGSVYTAFYSADGKNWVRSGQVDVTLKDIQAGVVAFEGAMNMRMGMGARPGQAAAAPAAQSTPFKACFDWFKIENK